MLRAGALLGLAVLAKLTALALVPGLALVILFRMFQAGPGASSWRERAMRGLRMSVGAIAAVLLVCGWWLLRNMLIYGEPTGSLDALHSYAEWNAKLILDLNLDLFLRLTWESLWGLFGGMSIRMPMVLYDLAGYLAIVLVALSGVALLFFMARRGMARHAPTRLPTYAWQAGVAMLAVASALVVGYLRFNLTIGFQPQARYFFMLLLPLSMLYTGSLYALVPGRRLKAVALSVPLLWLAFLNVEGLAAMWGRPWGT
jgi:hypothetical protein